jgi:hypothetical protein
MKTSLKNICTMKGRLLIKVFFAGFLVVAFSFAAIPTRAGGAEDKAKQAFADWKAAKDAVAAAKEKLAEANKALQNAMTAIAKSGGKTTDAQEAALAQARAAVAAAEAALREAEKQELAVRIELENAIAELPDGPLKDQLKRERNFPSLVSANGLHTIRFATPSGRLTLNLPDDMRAGDTISGTVVMEPNGNTQEEREKNLAELQGLVFEIRQFNFATQSSMNPVMSRIPVVSDKPFMLKLPQSSPRLGITLNSSNGSVPIGNNQTFYLVTSETPDVVPVKEVARGGEDFKLPTIAQQGRFVEIPGHFDGSFESTRLTVGNQEVPIIAESPRKTVFESPRNFTGPTEIAVKEGNVETKGSFRNLGVRLSAPKTNLLKGESTTLTIKVEGLEGIKNDVPLYLNNASPAIIRMEGGDKQTLRITPSAVQTDGTYLATRTLTGQQAGAFSLAATVVAFNQCLEDDGDPLRVLLFNTSTGDYSFCSGSGSANVPTKAISLSTMDFNGGISVRAGETLAISNIGSMKVSDYNYENFANRKVRLEIDGYTHTGTATVQTMNPNQTFMIRDRDTRNNTCTCR